VFPSGISPNTSELYLDNNEISTLEDYTFKSLRELMTFSAQSNRISEIHKKAFCYLATLKILDLYDNHIVTLYDSVFSPLMSLTSLDIGCNRIATFNQKALINVTQLQNLMLSMNSLNAFPVFTYQNESLVPELTFLDLDVNNIESIPCHNDTKLVLDSLTHLSICCNRLTQLKKHNFKHFPNLQSIKIHRNELKKIDSLAFESDKIIEINLKFSYIPINDIFHHTPNLRKLELTNNFALKPGTMFQNLSKLTYLDIGETRVKFGYNMFLGTPSIEYLDMSSNAISELGSQYFEHLKNLKTLDLYGNQLTTVNFTSLPSQLWKRLEHIDLSLNPYICDCSIVWFRKWMRSSNQTVNVVKKNYHYKYECIAPAMHMGLAIKNLTEPTAIECFTSEIDWYLNSIVIIVFTIGFASLILSMVHRFRWHVRYWRFVYEVS